MRDQLVVGVIPQDGRRWVGIEHNGESTRIDRLLGPLSGRITDVLIVGDDSALRKLAELVLSELDEEQP